MTTKVRYVEAKYDTTLSWDIEAIAEKNNFKMEEIDNVEVGKWTRLFITLKDGTQFWEDGYVDSDALIGSGQNIKAFMMKIGFQ